MRTWHVKMYSSLLKKHWQSTELRYSVPLCSRNFQNVKLRQHGLKILLCACHSDFTWNFGKFKWSKNVIFGSFTGSEFEFLANLSHSSSPNWPKHKVWSLWNCKMAIFDIQILPKLITRKIEWEIKSCIVDHNFTFWKFLEHSVLGWRR